MALQVYLDNTVIDGNVYPESYAIIDFIRVMPVESCPFVVWFADVNAKLAGDPPVKAYEFAMPTSALTGNLYESAYAWLKTQPEFAGAIEVP